MNAIFVFLAASALGVEAGWEPLPEGGYVYTIQIEPDLLRLLESGHEISSQVPAHIDVRQYRITTGTGALPRVAAPPLGQPTPTTQTGEAPSAASPHLAVPGSEPAAAESSAPLEMHHQTSETQPPAAPEPVEMQPGHEDHETAAVPNELPASDPVPPLSAQHAGFNGDAEKHADHGDKSPAEAGAAPHLTDSHTPAFGHGAADTSLTKESPGKEAAAKHSPADHSTTPPTSVIEPGRPWMPFLIAAVLLCGSLGANLYLGWIAWDARSRYRDAVAKYRAIPAT